MLRKIKAYITLIAFAVISSIMPMRAYAFFPAVAAVAELGTVGGAAVAAGSVAVGLGIGAAIAVGGHWAFCYAFGCEEQPPGWSRDNSGKVHPPNMLPSAWLRDGAGNYYQDINSLCATYGCTPKSWNSAYFPSCNCTYSFNAYTYCPAGYSLSGSSCVMTTEDSVRKPNGVFCQVLSWSGGYDPRNPGCPTGGGAPSGTSDAGTKWQYTSGSNTLVGSYAGGGSFSLTAPPVVGGKGTFDNQVPGTVAGAPVTQDTAGTLSIVGPGSAPVVDGVTQNILPGQGTAVSPPGSTSSGTATGATVPNIDCSVFSNCDWAKNSVQTQQLAAEQSTASGIATVVTNTGQIASALAPTVVAPNTYDAVQGQANINSLNNLQPKNADYQPPLSSILNKLGIPTTGGSCTLTRTWTLWGKVVTINFVQPGFCETYQPIANWMVWGLIAIYGWNTLRKDTSSDG